MGSEIPQGEDPTEEAAAIRRLAEAAVRTDDDMTAGATVAKAARLAKQTGFSLNPTVTKLLKLDKLSKFQNVDNQDKNFLRL